MRLANAPDVAHVNPLEATHHANANGDVRRMMGMSDDMGACMGGASSAMDLRSAMQATSDECDRHLQAEGAAADLSAVRSEEQRHAAEAMTKMMQTLRDRMTSMRSSMGGMSCGGCPHCGM